MTTQKRIERKAVSLFCYVNGWKYTNDDAYRQQNPEIICGWLSLAKKVIRLENRVRIMRVNEFKK